MIAATLIGVAVGRYPWLRMNRATIALVGAAALLAMGAISLGEAYRALELDTLVLLFAMMVLNVNLRLAGFFRLVAAWITELAATPRQLLALVVLASGVLSAVFLNDTIVLMFTPLVLEVASALKRNPLPYLMGLVTAANVGSMATIVGNPQNMIVGMSSGISFGAFTLALAPIALAGLVVCWAVLALAYRGEVTSRPFESRASLPARAYRPLLRKSMAAAALMVSAFALGAPMPLAALTAAALLLFTRRLKPERVFRELDWSLLVFFASLFVVTGAIETTGWSARLFEVVRPLADGGPAQLSVVAMVLSNLVSNVPAVLLFRPVVPSLADPRQAWLVLAMATTLAGNLTLLGSVANLIAAESAGRRGVRLSFGEYARSGVPITLLTLAIGVIWLAAGR